MTRSFVRIMVPAAVLMSAMSAAAQTPLQIEELGKSKPAGGVSNLSASAANPWLGAQVAFKPGGTNEFSDDLLVSAQYIHEIPLGLARFHLPTMVNISDLSTNASITAAAADQLTQKLQALIMSSSGFRAGVYPYFGWILKDTFKLYLHAEASVKINGMTDSTNATRYVKQGRFGGGIEMLIGKFPNEDLPMTLSLTPVDSVVGSTDYQLVFGDHVTHPISTEVTGVFPIHSKIGVLIEDTFGGNPNVFRVAIIIATGK